MKEVLYNGGMIVFSVPDAWQEQTYPDGGASYFPGDGEDGSLYVTLMTARQDTGVTEEAFRELADTGRQGGDAPAQLLPNGNYLRRFERESPEGGGQHTVFWMLSNLVPPNTARIATFNYGVPAGQISHPQQVATVAMLEEQIRRARFTSLTPEQVLAAQRAARPWWKLW